MGLALEKEKLPDVELRDKNPDLVLLLKVLKEDKCHYIEDFQRGFKPIGKNIAIINISDIENFIKNKKIKIQDEINIKNLVEKKLINKKFNKLKILGNGEIKEKITIKTNFISKSAKSKIEKAGGAISVLKDKSSKNV